MAIDADLNGVIANVGNGVGHWKRMATRLARTLAEPQARSGTGRTERRAAATSGPKYRHDRTVTQNRCTILLKYEFGFDHSAGRHAPAGDYPHFCRLVERLSRGRQPAGSVRSGPGRITLTCYRQPEVSTMNSILLITGGIVFAGVLLLGWLVHRQERRDRKS